MKKIVAAIVIILVVGSLMFWGSKHFYEDVFEHTIDSLNTKIDSLQDSIVIKDQEIHVYEEKVQEAEKKLEENKGKIKVIYKEYEETIQTVDGYDVNQLQQFFTDRYSSSISK